MNSVVPEQAGRREWIGLAVLALPCILYAMDLTVLNLAVPSLSADLKPSSAQLLWIIDIYGFLVAGSLITMGTLGDRIGRRRLLLTGAVLFAITSVLAAFSRSAGMLITTRALLGIAGATVAPSTLSLIRNMFLDPNQRQVAIGVWISSYSVGAAIGPLLGGVLLEYFWWGSVFLLAVPIMIVLLVAGPALLPEFRDPAAGRIDLPSAALSLVAVLAVIYGLKQVAQDGFGWIAALSILGGLAAGAVFVRRQQRLADPLIDLRLFQVPAFTAALTMYTLSIFGAFGAFIFMAQYLQLVLGLSPLKAGLWTMPWPLAFVVGSMLTPVIARKVPAVFLMVGGLLLAAVGFGILTLINGGSPLAIIAAGSVVMSLGLAPVFTLANDMILSTAPPERAGAASGISETGAEFGGALGIAILGSIGIAVYRNGLSGAIPTGIPPKAAETARDTLGGALAVAEQLPAQLGSALVDVARSAFVQGFEVTVIIGAVVMVGLAILATVMLRNVRSGPEGEGQSELTTAGAVAEGGGS